MEGNFLSRYNNKLDAWKNLIEEDPENKQRYETEMSDYIIKCMPYMNKYNAEDEGEVSVDNAFNVKVTTGLKRKDIFNDYLIDVENVNIPRNTPRIRESCPTCKDSVIVHFPDTSELVCQTCGLILARLISEELTYREEQETSEKIINYSYKRENHFSEWLSQFQAQETTNIPTEVIEQLRNELKKLK